MLATAHAACLIGVEAHPVQVEVQLGDGLPGFDIVGLPERAVRESRIRVKAALSSIGFGFPPRHLVLNLAPGDLRKHGAGFDLAIAASVLAACGAVPAKRLADTVLVGELSLSGELKPVRGVLAQLLCAHESGLRRAIVPPDNLSEASFVEELEVRGATHMGEVVQWLRGEDHLAHSFTAPTSFQAPVTTTTPEDLAEVRGQAVARRTLEIAAAGGHHTLFIGSPGAGKTMLARCMPSILPPPSPSEALEIATIGSSAGFAASAALSEVKRPFRAPHHTASAAALVGGGEPIRAGEITLAHRGVLFLDELPEFRRDAIETLRTTMETGVVVVARAQQRVRLPARPLVIAAMNPCPCGYDGDPSRLCACSPGRASRYRSRLSGPLLDRFDLQVAVARVSAQSLRRAECGEPSSAVRTRVCQARTRLSAAPPLTDLRSLTERVSAEGLSLLEQGVERLGMSARGYVKALKVAHTIAALESAPTVLPQHTAEALQYRVLDREPG